MVDGGATCGGRFSAAGAGARAELASGAHALSDVTPTRRQFVTREAVRAAHEVADCP